MLEYIVIIGLIAAAGYWILVPILKPDQSDGSLASKVDEKLGQLNLRKERVYETIRELEFDFKMGKLSEEDFNELTGQYKLDAVRLLKEIDAIEPSIAKIPDLNEKDIEKEIEQEVSLIRGSKSVKGTDLYCTQCGVKTSGEDRFCHKCGAPLGSA